MMNIISFSALLFCVSAHSWVECTHYTGDLTTFDPTQCNAIPRPLSDGRNVGADFGSDIGMDHRPSVSGNQCQGDLTRGLSSNYPSGLVTYEAGKTYTLAWPDKNHVAATCTNTHIPDTALDLYAAPYNGQSDPSQFTNAIPASFSEQRHEDGKIDFRGFQNCPNFCNQRDSKSLCTGTFSIPVTMAPGIYTFQWHWAFNSNTDVYSTCWEANVVGGSGTTSSTTSITPTSTPQSTTGAWKGGMKLTHFWDCNGMGCDATTLQPWDADKYVASPGYSPQDPNDFGGSVYGEKMWVVGAASDTLANMLGPDDGCCGSDSDSMGCGRCALIRVPSATNSDWTALIMKKNRCPPHSNGCGTGNVHFDVAVPGYDNLDFSTANVCGERANTGFASRQESAVLGDWYNQHQNTAQAVSRCGSLPSEFQKGCELFSEWGWTRGDPPAEFRVVDCPSAFKDYVADQFDANGVVTSDPADVPEPTTTTTSTSTSTSSEATTASNTDAPSTTTSAPTPSTSTTTAGNSQTCALSACGCGLNGQPWCNAGNSFVASEWCQNSPENCSNCNGVWCANSNSVRRLLKQN